MQSSARKTLNNFADTKLGFGLIIVCICVVVFAYARVYNAYGKNYSDYMFGYWVADDAFCQDSDIDSMLLFIGKPSTAKNGTITRPAHMVIGDDIMNQKITIKCSPVNSGFSKKLGAFSVKCEIEFEDECQIPNNVVFDFDMTKGSLRIHDDEKLYALMYKDHEITSQFTNAETTPSTAL